MTHHDEGNEWLGHGHADAHTMTLIRTASSGYNILIHGAQGKAEEHLAT